MNKNIVLTVGFIYSRKSIIFGSIRGGTKTLWYNCRFNLFKEIDDFRFPPSRNKNIVVTVGFIFSRKSIIFGSVRAGTKIFWYNCRFILFKEIDNFRFPSEHEQKHCDYN